jgi:serine/threonine protein kinase
MSATPAAIPPELAASSAYTDIRELGKGGMGVVYLAKNRLMDRVEVLKVVNRIHLEDPVIRERFLREIRAAAQLLHANVVVAYSAQEMGPSIVLAMEYVPGEDLQKVVKASGPLSVRRACTYASQVALGLQHAHERGMVHRDIKPSNILCTTQNKKTLVKIADFGLAKITSELHTDTNLTATGQALGTPLYMAPEQARDATTADIRADIYSLGATLYYLLAGKPPIEGKTYNDILIRLITEEPKAIETIRGDVSPELAAAIAKMLAKDPCNRFPTPNEVAKALLPFCKATASGTTTVEASVAYVPSQGVIAFSQPDEVHPMPRHLQEEVASLKSVPKITATDSANGELPLTVNQSTANTDNSAKSHLFRPRQVLARFWFSFPSLVITLTMLVLSTAAINNQIGRDDSSPTSDPETVALFARSWNLKSNNGILAKQRWLGKDMTFSESEAYPWTFYRSGLRVDHIGNDDMPINEMFDGSASWSVVYMPSSLEITEKYVEDKPQRYRFLIRQITRNSLELELVLQNLPSGKKLVFVGRPRIGVNSYGPPFWSFVLAQAASALLAHLATKRSNAMSKPKRFGVYFIANLVLTIFLSILLGIFFPFQGILRGYSTEMFMLTTIVIGLVLGIFGGLIHLRQPIRSNVRLAQIDENNDNEKHS